MWETWCEWPEENTPDGSMLHSVIVDPRDANHLYLGLSGGGVFESTDGGSDWAPLNKGVAAAFLPTTEPEFGHDPHTVRMHPLLPDRLYQQNHCGIYRIDRPEERWTRIGDNMPPAIGDIGFPIELHPRDPDTAWVFPMDGTDVWPRTSVDGRPVAYVTRDAGASWSPQSEGLPERAWFTVKRQAMTTDAADPVGVYFGTTSGEVWASADEGASWARIAEHLPEICSVEVGSVVEAGGGTLGEVLDDLDRQFPGIRFRMVDEQGRVRQHMKLWIGQEAASDLSAPVRESDEVTIMQALSGG
jgi:molybdopterin converting factor small subunit